MLFHLFHTFTESYFKAKYNFELVEGLNLTSILVTSSFFLSPLPPLKVSPVV